MRKGLFSIILLLFYNNAYSQINESVANHLNKKNLVEQEQSELVFEYSKVFPNKTQISIAIIEDGVVEFYGIERRKDVISHISNHQCAFEIGSLTKIFTSTLLAGFVVNKNLKLNDAINDYLEIPLKNDVQISFLQLANHTSGLPRLPTNLKIESAENPYQKYDEKKLKEYLTQDLKLFESSSKSFNYSNLGTGLLGFVLGEISGKSFNSLLQEKIFSEYGMENSTTNREEVEDILIPGLDAEGNEVSNWDFSVLVGAGGILSTVEDLSKFMAAQFDTSNQELALTRKTTFNINENLAIGLGWHILKMERGRKWYFHNGGTGGYSSSVIMDTENKNAVIVLSNVSAFGSEKDNIEKLCFELMKTLGNKE